MDGYTRCKNRLNSSKFNKWSMGISPVCALKRHSDNLWCYLIFWFVELKRLVNCLWKSAERLTSYLVVIFHKKSPPVAPLA
jgi:hypothetical protein